MTDTVIKVKNVSKKFCRTIKHTMLYGGMDLTRSFLSVNQRTERLRNGEFWAADDISFELKRGEALGIIGPNGSGKSTVLKMLNGIFMPDKGEIEIKGRVGALIEVGAGFHPILTGRENIYINGAILGMSKNEIDRKFDEIVNFADIGDFIDSPIKHYSSGMFVRLGFSVAVHSNPDILLVDEILAVGDIRFQNKSYEHILKMKDNCSIIFVSHNLASVSKLCYSTLWLNKGRLIKKGETNEVVKEYSIASLKDSLTQKEPFSSPEKTISGDLYIEKVELYDGNGKVTDKFSFGDDLVVRCHYNAKKYLGEPFFRINIASKNSDVIFGACMMAEGTPREKVYSGRGVIECWFQNIPLESGIYYISFNVIPEIMFGGIYRQIGIRYFEVQDEKTSSHSSLPDFFGGVVKVTHKWKYIE